MTMPPRAVERVLESLGASPDMTEEVVGDLAEEFELRVEEDDPQAACLWYYREALRAVPHLVGDALSRLRPRDVRRSAGIGLGALALLYAIGISVGTVGWTAYGIAVALGMPPVAALGPGPLVFALGLTLGVSTGVAGGYLAVWLDRRAALGSALAFGLVATCEFVSLTTLATAFVPDATSPLWYRIATPIVLLTGALLGGALRVARRPAAAPATR